MSDIQLALALVFLPLAGAALALVSKTLGSERLASRVETLGACLGLLAPWAALAALTPAIFSGGLSFTVAGWNPLVGIAYRFDGLSWLLNALVFSVTGAAYLYSRGRGPSGPVFTMLLLIQTAALSASASTADLFNLFVCLEMIGLASYVLVAFSEKPAAFFAAFRYLVLSSAAMVFFLAGLFGLYKLTGSLSYEGVARGLSSLSASGRAIAAASIACVAAATVLRVAVMPLHGWLPDAHALAPHAVSALLSGVLLKLPLFALGRFLFELPLGSSVNQAIGAAGALGTLAAVLAALSQKDAKRLLAYHSVSQVGYICAAWGLATPLALSVAYQHSLYHAMFKALLFLTVGILTDAAGTKDVYALRGAAGFVPARRGLRFITSAAYFAAALSICALPPFNGFWSKSAISRLFYGSWQYWILFAAGAGTIASFIKLSMIFMPGSKALDSAPQMPPAANEAAAQMPRAANEAAAPTAMLILALLCVLSGLFAGRLAAFSDALLGVAENSASGFDPSELLKTGLSILLGVGIFFAATSRLGKRIAAMLRSISPRFSHLVAFFLLGLCILSIAARNA